ncbi:MAG: nucleotidyltransferase substrate binding protein [Haliscomenobacter sp.]|nr:nucleotidyltransferase substrate binding protein [Haliscomenobacter sp.]MBK8043378.1 nucleotidyltransferase substrate binding protein [Haliscomenobacter sp.]MBK8654086.1 nucleotidyltransferase substrate binding protein [Haliscomenobacter sp.]MBK8879672.1 nucleotidyltransferase substrate binding protein [Haliscomenobacter sp.]MBP9078222.1 nucleotidyltransferase substrate binding protein [Haliscomenobacter sp.]
MEQDIRWQQRFSNFKKALGKLAEGAAMDMDQLSELEKEGMIQRFEYTHELAWNTLKDFLQYEGVTEPVLGSRDTTREAFSAGLIPAGAIWMDMIKARNQTSHTYNEATANEIFDKIVTAFLPCFLDLEELLEQRLQKSDG